MTRTQLPPQPIEDRYEAERRNRHGGGYWFEPDTLRFFSSRIGSTFLPVPEREVSYFTTSERFECYGTSSHGYHAEPRRYTVRRIDWRTGAVDTVGEFQAYSSSAAALAAARRYAAGAPEPAG